MEPKYVKVSSLLSLLGNINWFNKRCISFMLFILQLDNILGLWGRLFRLTSKRSIFLSTNNEHKTYYAP